MFSIVRVLLLGGFVGKILGVFRELLGAWLFGTGLIANAFRLSQSAFLIPLHGFVSDAVNGGFTPNFSHWREIDPPKAAALFSGMHLILLAVSCFASILLFVFSPQWVVLLAPGFDAESAAMATNMVRILTFALPAYAVVSLYAAADLVTGRGAITAARASVQSIGLILGTLFAWYLKEPLLIPLGFVLSYFYLGIWGFLAARAAGLVFDPRKHDWNLMRPALVSSWKVFRVLFWVPVILQINQIVERRVGSILNPESIAGLDYARFVTETLIILIAVPFALAGQAKMSTMTKENFEMRVLYSIRILLIIGVPISIFLATNSELFVRLFFQRGAFGESSVQVTSAIISGQAIGIFAGLIAYAAQRFLNARGMNSAVLKATAIGACINITMNYFLGDYVGVQILGISGSCMAFAIAIIALNKLDLIQKLRRDFIFWISIILSNIAFIEVMNTFSGLGTTDKAIANMIFWLLIFLVFPKLRIELIDFYKRLKTPD